MKRTGYISSNGDQFPRFSYVETGQDSNANDDCDNSCVSLLGRLMCKTDVLAFLVRSVCKTAYCFFAAPSDRCRYYFAAHGNCVRRYVMERCYGKRSGNHFIVAYNLGY